MPDVQPDRLDDAYAYAAWAFSQIKGADFSIQLFKRACSELDVGPSEAPLFVELTAQVAYDHLTPATDAVDDELKIELQERIDKLQKASDALAALEGLGEFRDEYTQRLEEVEPLHDVYGFVDNLRHREVVIPSPNAPSDEELYGQVAKSINQPNPNDAAIETARIIIEERIADYPEGVGPTTVQGAIDRAIQQLQHTLERLKTSGRPPETRRNRMIGCLSRLIVHEFVPKASQMKRAEVIALILDQCFAAQIEHDDNPTYRAAATIRDIIRDTRDHPESYDLPTDWTGFIDRLKLRARLFFR